MTLDQPTALVEVTDADREAASAAYYDCYDTPPNALWMAKMENGDQDDDPLVQAFARHRIAALEEAARVAEADTARLDFLDQMNAAKNEFHGTRYGWKYDVNHNRIALSDHNWPPLKVREAIDQARERHAAIRKAKEGGRG